MDFDIKANTVYLVKHGSQAYGTSLPESDLDVKGCAVAPKRIVLGFAYGFEQHEEHASKKTPDDEKVPDALDSVIYDIRKFCNLAANCNPNIVEVLFVDEADILGISPAGQLIRENRELFLSRKARYSFSGYAIAQLKRIKTHRKWLLSPPTHAPERSEFGLGKIKITADMMGAFDKILASEVAEEGGLEIDPNVMQLVQSEKQYRSAHMQWKQFLSWKASRNVKRSELEAKFGYDTKHAMHLVRLLRMCREILLGKGVLVRRPDAEELLGIRRGDWKYDDLIEWAEKEDAAMQELDKASTLRHHPDMERLNALCIQAQEIFWEHGKSWRHAP